MVSNQVAKRGKSKVQLGTPKYVAADQVLTDRIPLTVEEAHIHVDSHGACPCCEHWVCGCAGMGGELEEARGSGLGQATESHEGAKGLHGSIAKLHHYS